MSDSVGSSIKKHTKDAQYPEIKSGIVQFTLGVVNCGFFGVGVMLAGIINKDLADFTIGFLQMVLPVVGWLWAIVWGLMMVMGSFRNKEV